jgi:ChpA-C
MTSWTRRTTKTLLLTASIAAAATALPAAAFAATGPTTSGNGAVASGNQVIIPITIPINVCGNAVALLGASTAVCDGGASVTGTSSTGSQHTSGTGSVLSGNQVTAPIKAPVDMCGNAVNGKAHCVGGATVRGAGTNAGRPVTSGNGSVASGNQVVAPITAPVNVCGNSVAVLGVAGAGCEGGASVGSRPVSGRNWMPQCKCQDGPNAVTSLLPAYSSALGLTKLTAYTAASPLPAGLGSLPLVSNLPGLTNIATLPALASTPVSGVAAA